MITLLPTSLFIACTAVPQEKPIDIQAVSTAIHKKSPANHDFQQYLLKMGYDSSVLPFQNWGIDELTLCAAFFHPKLAVAKNEYLLARIQTQKAGLNKSPSINGELGRSNQKNGDIRPWAYGLTVSLPISTNNKRELRLENAKLSAARSKMRLASILWALRQQLSQDYLKLQKKIADATLIADHLSLQRNIVKMIQKRVDAGISDSANLLKAQLVAYETKHLLNQKRGEIAQLKAKLAADVGLTSAQLSTIQLENITIESLLNRQLEKIDSAINEKSLQADALLNRIDVRESLADYAVAESEIKLRAAQKIPDITLSPGFIFEFGDSVWSLGLNSLIRTLSQHDVLIAEAEQLRDIEGAKFELLQSNIIAQLEQTLIFYKTARAAQNDGQQQLAQQKKQASKMQKQFDAGLIDSLTLAHVRSNLIVAQQKALESAFNLLLACNQIENVLQKPLTNDFKMPEVNDE